MPDPLFRLPLGATGVPEDPADPTPDDEALDAAELTDAALDALTEVALDALADAKAAGAARTERFLKPDTKAALDNLNKAITKADKPEVHPSTAAVWRFFEYEHLPDDLAAVSKPICELADQLVADLPEGPEKTVALRKLLEAKDAAVRAALTDREA